MSRKIIAYIEPNKQPQYYLINYTLQQDKTHRHYHHQAISLHNFLMREENKLSTEKRCQHIADVSMDNNICAMARIISVNEYLRLLGDDITLTICDDVWDFYNRIEYSRHKKKYYA